jgi:hypothetical protein
MATIKNGLSYFEGAGSADAPSPADEDNTQNINTGGLQVTPAKNKTGFSFSDKATLDPTDTAELKDRLQSMIDERTGPMSTFLGGLQRASAWGSGGLNGPAATLAALDREKILQNQDTTSMIKELAGIKAGERQLASDKQFMQGLRSQTAQVPTIAGQAPTPGVAQAPSTPGNIPGAIWQRMQNAPNDTVAKTIYDDWLALEGKKATERKYSPDMDTPVEGVMFEGKPLPMTRRQFVQFTENNPDIARALMKQNPGLAETIGVSVTGADPAIAARQAGLPVISGERSNNKQWELYDNWVAAGRKGNPVARPGTSPHEFRRGLDIDMGKATEKDIAWLKANDYYQPDWATNKASGKYDPNHWEKLPMSKAKAELTVSKENAPVTGATKEEYAANVKLQSDLKSAANQAFIKGQYDPLAATVESQKNDTLLAQDVLEAIKTGSYGPGSGVNQAIMRAAQALGIGTSEKDAQQYLNNLTITRAKELFKASGARDAMGSQFTASESENFGKTLADITDPKEYIKNVYQLKIAMAKMNQEYLDYLDEHPTDLVGAKKQWKASGRREEILRENVDYLREREEKRKGKSGAASKEGEPKKSISFNDLPKG